MAPYIMAEHPALTANEAITESRRIMDGNKWRLFCLDFSFIGWELLCVLPMLAGFSWVVAAFSDAAAMGVCPGDAAGSSVERGLFCSAAPMRKPHGRFSTGTSQRPRQKPSDPNRKAKGVRKTE